MSKTYTKSQLRRRKKQLQYNQSQISKLKNRGEVLSENPRTKSQTKGEAAVAKLRTSNYGSFMKTLIKGFLRNPFKR